MFILPQEATITSVSPACKAEVSITDPASPLLHPTMVRLSTGMPPAHKPIVPKLSFNTAQ